MTAITKSQLSAALSAIPAPRTAWGRGVLEYAREMVADLDPDTVLTRDTVRRVVLNGATDARQYSEGGCALIYDCDIAARVCTPSELKRKKGGALPPNRNETWLDVQTRAINQALDLIARAARRASFLV
jgi:hypothetical protein